MSEFDHVWVGEWDEDQPRLTPRQIRKAVKGYKRYLAGAYTAPKPYKDPFPVKMWDD